MALPEPSSLSCIRVPFRRLFALLACVCGVSGLSIQATADDEYNPPIAAASDEGELAKSGFKIPEGFQVELFAAEPLLANPVVFSFDEQGRVFVCETFRQGKGVEDNRNHMDWLEDDLSLRSVDDRLEMFRKFLGETVSDYSKEQDRLRLLEDTDGDGKADKSTVFADGFNEIVEGTGAGVLAHKGNVYYTNIPRLWRMSDTNGDGVMDEKEALHDGFGVRVAFRGHDMHGLTLGPDGRLYFSIGDRGYNVTTQEGKRLVRPDTGAVFRCELDGSDLEVFAYGLRNPQELAFDDYGNLFTGDNNSDSGDQARWVHVVEGSDSGWRMYFQYLSDRGPWNRERMWHPYQNDEETSLKQPAYIVPPVRNVSDGPSGLVYYPGVGLPERYKGHFFLADFRGSSSQSGVRSFAVEPHGATFKLIDEHWFLQQILATDVDFGYDGKMYVSDWVDGWTGPGKGRIYTFFDPEHRKAADENNVAKLFRAGFDQLNADRLAELLQHPDRRVRQEAQYALANDNEVTTLTQFAKSSPEQLARVHAIWGLWQIGRQKSAAEIETTLTGLLQDDDAEIRAQAIRVLGEIGSEKASKPLQQSLGKGSPREQYFAAIALGRLGASGSVEPLVKLLFDNGNEDAVLRHAAVMGLVGCAAPDQLMRYADHDSYSVRLGLVLALRRMHSAQAAAFLHDDERAVVDEAARAIHDLPIAAALPSLAALAEEDLAGMSDALLRRVLNANYRLGGPWNARQVARIAVSEDVSDAVQKEAVFALLHWDEVPVLDRVTNEHRPLPQRSINSAREAAQSALASLLSGSEDLRADAARLAAKYRLQDAETELLQLVQNDSQPAAARAEALTALHAIASAETAAATERALQSDQAELRLAAYRVLASTAPERAAKVIDKLLGQPEASIDERQQAIGILAAATHDAADETLLKWLEKLAARPGDVTPELHLDLMEAALEQEAPAFSRQLAAIEAARDPGDPLAAVRAALVGGNAARGREVFFGNAAASCRRCHKVNGEGSDVGPDLSGIGKQQNREYLLEAIMLPNAKIAKGFETVIFVLDDGRTYTGIIKGEDETSYQLMTAQGEVVRVPKESVDFRTAGRSGMPDDVAKSLTRSDIRDLVEYLSTLQTPAVGGAAHGEK